MGLDAYERILKTCAGKFSVEDQIILADMYMYAEVQRTHQCLVSVRSQVGRWPLLNKVLDNLDYV